MQVSSTQIIFLIAVASVIFLIVPVFLISYIILYNGRKKKYKEEQERLQQAFEKELWKTQMEVQEQTLQGIAQNLHDNIGQLLSLTSVTLSSINLADAVKASAKISSAEGLTRRCLKEIRQLANVLYGHELLRDGLAAAIAFELDWVNRSEQFLIEYSNHGYTRDEQHREKDIIMFRLFQEILNNILRHSEASAISIILEQQDNRLTLSILDNGIGFDVQERLTAKSGMGLHNIQRRAAMINGKAVIASEPGNGTHISITVVY